MTEPYEELLKWLSRSVGSLEQGIRHHLENEGLPLWRLLDPVFESLPDQGIEKATSHPLKATSGVKREADPSASEGEGQGEEEESGRTEGSKEGRRRQKDPDSEGGPKAQVGTRQIFRNEPPPLAGVSEDFVLHEPWDSLRGRDVFKDGGELGSRLDEPSLGHFAPNCATFSRAREIPMKRVSNPPRPLRNETFPEGTPSESPKLSKKARERLHNATKLADLSAEKCLYLHSQKKLFSLENPGRSHAHELKSWKRPWSLCHILQLHVCGITKEEFQSIITNSENLARGLSNRLCKGARFCDQDGGAHLKWRPVVMGGKLSQFMMGNEREYPLGRCEASASSIRTEELSLGFIEVFSGKNAPLSHAVGRVTGREVPGLALETLGHGVKTELNTLAALLATLPLHDEAFPRALDARNAESRHRVAMIEASKQPSYGKRVQLIPDGLEDPMAHMNNALLLSHPFCNFGVLKEDHAEALSCMRKHGKRISHFRVIQTWGAEKNCLLAIHLHFAAYAR